MEPTYAELAIVLKKLNFVNKSNSKVFLYQHPATGAEVVLPLNTDLEKVRKAKFAAISWGLEEFGVLKNEHDLAKLIEQLRMAEKQPSS